MNIFILADEEQQKEIMTKAPAADTSVFFATAITDLDQSKNYDAFVILSDTPNFDAAIFNGKPVFVNKVIETLAESGYPQNVARINAWPGFLERPLWEVASNNEKMGENIFASLNRKVVFVKDQPGFVAARVISMIVNEAFFAFGENISTIEEIDKAMKLGTSYPKGPLNGQKKLA